MSHGLRKNLKVRVSSLFRILYGFAVFPRIFVIVLSKPFQKHTISKLNTLIHKPLSSTRPRYGAWVIILMFFVEFLSFLHRSAVQNGPEAYKNGCKDLNRCLWCPKVLFRQAWSGPTFGHFGVKKDHSEADLTLFDFFLVFMTY